MNFITFVLILISISGTVTLDTLDNDTTCCDPGWTYSSDSRSCYLMHEEELDWASAEQQCRSKNGSLASVHNTVDVPFFIRLIQNTCESCKQPWLGGRRDEWSLWGWVNKKPFTFTNWAQGEPNDPNEKCMMMYENDEHIVIAGKWNDAACGKSRNPSICAVQAEPQCELLIGGEHSTVNCCEPGWQHFAENQYCYKMNTDRLNWYEASDHCSDEGGHLATINTAAENDFILSLATDPRWFTRIYVWIGGQQLANDTVVVADNEEESKIWMWSADNTIMKFRNWNEGEPNDDDESNCLEIYAIPDKAAGEWNDICCDSKRSSICSKPARSTCSASGAAKDESETVHEPDDKLTASEIAKLALIIVASLALLMLLVKCVKLLVNLIRKRTARGTHSRLENIEQQSVQAQLHDIKLREILTTSAGDHYTDDLNNATELVQYIKEGKRLPSQPSECNEVYYF